MLKIFNTQTREKAEFIPIKKNEITIYVCGMTVYDFCHIGHARILVTFDIIVRHLRQQGYKVTYVRNITDIDDKIIQRANENGEDINSLTNRFIDEMNTDATALGVLPPDQEPRATQHMDDIIKMIQQLQDNKLAYQADNNDVYYEVKKFKKYGKLSGKKLDELQSGARVDVADSKRDPLDFVLWKSAKPDEPSWDSPWGKGRPGWHIECSAMSTQCLHANFDIHGGGMDLIFPHHENEIAQSEGALQEKFVNYWMHVGFVRVDEEKMSKSLGNFFTIREVLKKYDPEIIRYFILTSHYRSPLNYTNENLDNAKAALNRFYTALKDSETLPSDIKIDTTFESSFVDAMNDDFNTPVALSILFDITREINRCRETDDSRFQQLSLTLKNLASRLGLLERASAEYLQGSITNSGLSDTEIDDLIQQRKQARADKNFARADEIRDTLQQSDILLEDNARGTGWRRK
jgi:cysteinyl-tRNA synthetase